MRAKPACLLTLALTLFAQEPIVRFGTTVVIPDGIRGQIYFLKPDITELPNLRKLKSVGVIYTTTINVPPQNFDQGFPGVTNRFEWFGIQYTGRFWVQYAGIHRFNLTSDDGSKLWIDGHLVIDNDGVHAPREYYGDIDLAVGLHRLELAYFQGPRFNVALVLKVAKPGGDWRIFNVDEFRPPAGIDLPAELPETGKKRK
jgi:hypothetical protein